MDEQVAKRLASIELAVAHLTEALEEVAKVLDPGASPSASLVDCHLRDIRANFNRIEPKGMRT